MWLFFILSVIAVGNISCKPFTATISTFGRYEVGKDVTCKVVITNSDVRDYYLLKRNTPLDELGSHSFKITQDGNPVPYDGLLYQRTPPTSKEFILVPAKSSISTLINLSLTYSLKTSAYYNIMLKTMITYYEHNISDTRSQFIDSNAQRFGVFGNQSVKKLTEAEVLRNNEYSIKTLNPRMIYQPEGYMTPLIAGTPWPGEALTTLNVYRAVYQILTVSIRVVDTDESTYTKFFGLRNTGYVNTVRGVYSDIKQAMEKKTFTFYFNGEVCATNSEIIAYTYRKSTTVYLCADYRSAPDVKGRNTKLGTLIHEMSHAVAYTEDIVYGRRTCMAYAQYEPEDAIRNADNYNYFCESLAQLPDNIDIVQ